MKSARATQTQKAQSAPAAATKTPPRPAPVRVSRPVLRETPPAVRLSPPPTTKAVSTPGPVGGGAPLPPAVRETLERSFKADLKAVRVHTNTPAQKAATGIAARAFTYGNHIFLGPGEKTTDLALLSHEVTHVLQQRGRPVVQRLSSAGQSDVYEREAHRASAAVARGETFAVRERTHGESVQRLGIRDVLDYFAGQADSIPGFSMFTIVLGVNPINMSKVDRSAANILRAVVKFIPGGKLITDALDKYEIFDKVGTWVEQQIDALGITGSSIKKALDTFVDKLDWTDLNPFALGDLWERAKAIFSEPIETIKKTVKGFIKGILDFLREAILKPLAKLAEGTDGYNLLKAVLGKDPITGEDVPQSAEVLIGGFMKLIGQEEVWQNIQKGNAVARAWTWFQGALKGLVTFLKEIPGLVISTLKSITLEDLLPLTNLFVKVGKAFGGFAVRFLSWAGEQVMSLLEIIFEVVAPAAMPYLKKAAGAFKSIIENPVGFVGNLVRAGIQGFQQFAGNFLKHLRKSLIEWLTGTMSGAAVYIPQAFSVPEIIKFVLSVLGLTWQNIRGKLVKAVGEGPVKAMEAAFDIVVTLVRDGPAAAWKQIMEGITNLREMVMEQVMSFVRDRVVQAAITKLVTSLNPAGAFIQAIIAIYNTIMFFIERIKQIMRVAMAFIDSISAIASGNTGTAANRVETTMAGMLTLVISFLARIAGLGKVSDAVVRIVNRVRAPIDKALDKVIAWIIAQARKLGKFVAQAGVPQDPKERIRLAAQAAVAAARRLSGKITQGLLSSVLGGIKVRYGLNNIVPYERGGRWWAKISINPEVDQNLDLPSTTGAAPAKPTDPAPPVGPAEAERQRQAIAATTAELKTLLTAGAAKPQLEAAVNALRARHRWATLEVRPAGGGRMDIRGGFSPQVNIISIEGSLLVVELVNMKVPEEMQTYWKRYEEWVRNNIVQGKPGSPGLLDVVHTGSGVTTPPQIMPESAAGRTQIPTGTPLPTGEVQYYKEANIGAVPRTPTTPGKGPLYRPDAVIMAPKGIVYVEITLKSDWTMLEASLAGKRTADKVNSQRIHKISQIPGTAAWFLQNYPASSGFTVVIMCNAEPSPTSKGIIQGWLRQTLYQSRNVTVVWVVAK